MNRILLVLALIIALIPLGAATYRETVIIPEMRVLIVPYLKDPSSAQFRNEVFSYYGRGPVSYCGEVNAKGELGGYEGFREFRVWEGQRVMFFAADDPKQLGECASYDNQHYFGWLYFLIRAKYLPFLP